MSHEVDGRFLIAPVMRDEGSKMEHVGMTGLDLEELAAELVGLSQAPALAKAVGDREEVREGNGLLRHAELDRTALRMARR